MTDEIDCASSDSCPEKKSAKKMKFSLIESDMQMIWEFVSEFVEFHMLKQKGVSIPNLGVFSFHQVKLDIGQNKYVLLQRPLFFLSEKICQTHGLKQHKTQITGSIPVVPLNYSSIMLKSSYSRDQIETCVRELITATNNAISTQSSTELLFSRIGRLQIRNQNVKFKFYKQFINVLDSSGKIMKALQNRPGTADSVMTDRPPTRPFTTVIPLPRINGLVDIPKLPAISETEMFDTKSIETTTREILNLETDEKQSPVMVDEDDRKESCVSKINMDTQQNTLPESVTNEFNFSTFDEIPLMNYESQMNAGQESNFAECGNNMSQDIETTESNDWKPLPTPKPPSRSMLVSDRKCSSINSTGRPYSCASSCGHGGPTGQELCYICYQREKRNIPVSFTEQIKEREKEEERVLQSFQNLKDKEHIMKEQENLLSKKHESQKIAAYNFGISEAVKNHQKSRDPRMYRSYIFEHRPLTPPKVIKQSLLSSELGKQVDDKATKRKKEDDDEAFMERLEQMQLAEDLAKQREQFFTDKEKQKEVYRKALDIQVSNKPLALPRCEPDSTEPFFGKNDVTKEKLLEKRMKAQEVFKDQLDNVEQKKRDAIVKKLQEQAHEEKVLERVKLDLLEDRAKRYQKSLQQRKTLETDWEKANREKKERDLVERLKISMPDDLLLHEQCDKYTRCHQCKRKLANHGQTNIWKETYFVPGSRYIY